MADPTPTGPASISQIAVAYLPNPPDANGTVVGTYIVFWDDAQAALFSSYAELSLLASTEAMRPLLCSETRKRTIDACCYIFTQYLYTS
jgi:hypothetical protein